MNDDPEATASLLRAAMPQPTLPPAWRAGILTAAARAPASTWYRRPVPLGLAAAWAAIGLLHLTSPPGLPSAPATAGPPPPLPHRMTTDQWLAVMEFPAASQP